MQIYRLAVISVLAPIFAVSAYAQWPRNLKPGTPKQADGKANMSAPAPKSADGKPDITGVWQPSGVGVGNIARDLKNGEVSFTPWAAGVYKERQDTQGKHDPQAYCVLSGTPREDFVPYPFKILYSQGMVVILYEALHSYRQIFMDGRPLPKDPQPTWMGYSVGRWDGDTLVVETAGLVEGGWIDNGGHPSTETTHVTERFRRKDFGHMDISVTIEDPKAYTKPWTVVDNLTLQPDLELIEYVCSENEKDLGHLVGKQ